MAAGIISATAVASSSNGSVTSKGSTSTTSKSKSKNKSLYKKLFKSKKKKHASSDGASLASIQEEISPSSRRPNNYPPSTVTTKSPVANNSNSNHGSTSNGNAEQKNGNNNNFVSASSNNGHPQPQSSLLREQPQQHNFEDITQTPFGCFEHGGIITRLHSNISGEGGAAGAPAPTAAPAASLAVETSLKVHSHNNNASTAAAAVAKPNSAAVPMTTTTNVNKEETNHLLAQHSLETIHICNTSSSEADNISALPTPSPFRKDDKNNNDHVSTSVASTPTTTHPPSIRNTSSNISALTEDPTGFYDSSVVSSSQASTANRSSLASFFGGTFSFASTTGSATSASIPVTPSPARRTAKLKMNVLPTISDTGSASSPLSPNYHVLSQQKHSTLEHSPLSSNEYSPSTSPSPIIEHSKASLLKQEALKQALEDAHVSSEGNFITRSRHFKKLVDWAFNQIDSDSTGQVDQQELYTGLLLIHLELAKYVGAAACRPMSRTQVYELFEKLDVDHSGTLCRDEFQSVMTILCSQLLTRVVTLFGSTILLVPLLTRAIVDGSIHVWSLDDFIQKRQQFTEICQTVIWPKLVLWGTTSYNMMDHGWNVTSSQISNMANITIPNLSTTQHVLTQTSANLWNQMFVLIQHYTPTFMIKAYHRVEVLYDQYVVPNIPDDLQETLPYAIVSCILASVLVPYMLVKIDNFFASLANKKSSQKQKHK